MGKKSRQQERARIKAEARKLSDDVAKLEETRIPASVASSPSLPENLSYLDGTNYQLIFERYNHKESELHSLDGNDFKSLITKFNMLTQQNSRSIKGTAFIRDKIENTGDYASLYAGLEPDIELVEIQYKDKGRIVCYFINDYPHGERPCSYCCVVSVLKKHRRT